MDTRLQGIIFSVLYLFALWTLGTEILGVFRDVMISINDTYQYSWLIQLIARAVFNPLSFSVPAIATIYKCVKG